MKKRKWIELLSNRTSMVIIIVTLLVTTASLSKITHDILYSQSEERFNHEIERVIDELERTVMTYNDVLLHHKSFFSASDPEEVTYEKWKSYLNHSDLFEQYPGIHVISFARYINDEESLAHYYDELLSDYNQVYDVWPEGEREEYLLNQFVAPSKHMSVGIGYDHFTEEKRKFAALVAKETGDITATSQITLITDGGDSGPGYIVYAPVYDIVESNGEVKEEWFGNVLGAFYIEELIASKLPNRLSTGVHFTIYDGVIESHPTVEELQERLLYSMDLEHEGESTSLTNEFNKRVEFPFSNLTWTIDFTSTSALNIGLIHQLPYFILLAGFIITLLVFLVIRSMSQMLRKAEFLAASMTEELSHVTHIQEAILNSADSMIISTNETGLIQTFNKGGERYLGYKADEVIGKHTPNLFHEKEDLEKKAEHLAVNYDNVIEEFNKGLLERNETFVEEVNYCRKDGTLFPVQLTITPLKDVESNTIGILGIAKDISQVKEAQEKIKDKDNLLSNIIETIPHPVFVKDTDGRYTLVNQATSNLFNLTNEQIIGKTVRDLPTMREEASKIEEVERKVIESGEPEYVQVQPVPDALTGDLRWFYTVKLPLQTREGLHLLGIGIDITERKWFEEELKSLRDKALVSSQAKSEFLAMMSHEIRTPMNAIIGMADLLIDTELSEEQRVFVNIFKKSGESLLRIINEVLDLSKVEAGHIMMEEEEFNLPSLLDEVVNIFSYQAQQKGLDLNLGGKEKIPVFVIGDRDRLRQIVSNLLGNAIKFTEEGEVSITVDASEIKESDKVSVRFIFKDTGIGIPKDKIDSIFERFTQVDNSSTRRFGGTGLGLTIVRSFIEKMEGSITVESELGKGSTFSFHIMLKNSDKNNHHIDLSSKPLYKLNKMKKLGSDEAFNKEKIDVLLVEDSPDNQVLIKAYLKHSYIKVDLAENGLQAFELFTENKYDVVFMDMQMPVMDGYTATKKIREWEMENKVEPTPILALTAHALKGDELKSIQAGCNAHLTKPIKKKILLNELIKYTSFNG
ncbi:CHASE domain-containing hybrid sensor histidine kinase/response regulator [Bacillus sp. FJAT-45350]|uniref:CHASE domain-containing hybrid sensor histidine kinase/response regulator n=1 Tax=Bacillus sp. FJAT-45350 TaxID=2011014 RepID=UPI000BB8732F|nr:PAS domain S-box protein [Bacillus sp. FJAT-45350]